MIGIIDYGLGNILSVKNAFEFLGASVVICKSPKELNNMERIVLPGVGSFGNAMENLSKRKFIDALNTNVIEKGKPILGICLGMQVMARKSYEGGEFDGLGWFDAEVIRINSKNHSLKIPHVGWDNLIYDKDNFIFKGLTGSIDVYFTHSYYMHCSDYHDVIAEFEYGDRFTAAVQKENIIATQFHPEKSQDNGLKILENFLNWNPKVTNVKEKVNS